MVSNCANTGHEYLVILHTESNSNYLIYKSAQADCGFTDNWITGLHLSCKARRQYHVAGLIMTNAQQLEELNDNDFNIMFTEIIV